ncbi:MAG: PAS domain-containing protein [Paracoccus sp. (in: a-proteobacteria)]|uniref:PAS domain-containing protein n=1 Tax=Paracoccus sp. TaxID=267 RepID=UPI0026E08BF9|nr:PAS domain-containing protein [Paracoccus sp. (in: a-proteobacteria)]MDO5622211.1 PAS domain-containing protein [Paracoccus sp. (in: a-proteobacteria)]
MLLTHVQIMVESQMTDRPIIDEERNVPELDFFISRTDPRGVIQAGNKLFFDVAAYRPAELIGAPHKMVRHPDTPRAVFRILWDRLTQGLPVGAYVKNRASDGRYYWVFALVAPVPGGYVSVRLKPGAETFAQARQLYTTIRKAELEGMPVDESVALLVSHLGEAGFADYEAFMRHAQMLELLRRPDARFNSHCSALDKLNQLRSLLSNLLDNQQGLLGAFGSLRNLPTNMRITAARLEPGGGPVSVIADIYQQIGRDTTTILRRMTAQGNRSQQMLERVTAAMFDAGSAATQQMASMQFLRSDDIPGVDNAQERVILETMCRNSAEKSAEGLSWVLTSAGQLRSEMQALLALSTSLDQIRVLGEVETGRMRDENDGLAAIMGQLTQFHEQFRENLERILVLISQTQAHARLAAA